MPIYEYCCDECGERFELFVRSSGQRATPVCPRCGSSKAHKAISLFGVGGAGENSKSGIAPCGPGPT